MAANGPAPLMNVDPQSSAAESPKLDLRSILGTMLRHRKLIVLVPLLSLVAAFGALQLISPVYKSTVDVLVFDPQQQLDQEVQKQLSPFVDQVDAVAMNTEIEVIKSKSLALSVARQLGLGKHQELPSRTEFAAWLTRPLEYIGLPAFGPSGSGSQPAAQPVRSDADRIDEAAEQLLAHLQVERVPASYILAITVTAHDPIMAQRLAAAVAENYLTGQRDARRDAVQRMAVWLKRRIDDLQAKGLASEAAIEKLKAKSGLNDVVGSSNISEQQISELNAQLMVARADVAAKRVRLEQARHLSEGNSELQKVPEVMASDIINQLRIRQLELTQREAQLRGILGDRHAQVIALRAQLAGINKALAAEADRIVSKMQNEYDLAASQEQSINGSLQKLITMYGESADAMKLKQLRRVADADRKLYDGYLSQYNEVSTRETLQDASARIISPATLPTAPSSPRRTLILAVAGIFGVGAAGLLVIVIEYLRAGVTTGAEVERAFGFPVVGTIPLVQLQWRSRHIAHDRLVGAMIDAPLSRLGEAVTAMRIGLRLTTPQSVPKVILVTSSIPGEGKSSTAMLLAASSSGSGQKTVLVDCDFRHPSLSQAFGNKHQGLSELLTGNARVDEVVIKHPATGTYMIPTGTTVRNPADLLTSEAMHNVIARLRQDYDYVVLDTSPLLPVVDTLTLAAMADKILLIVEWSRTSRVDVSEAFKILRPETGRIAGIVLNKVDLQKLQTYGYGRYYRYRFTR